MDWAVNSHLYLLNLLVWPEAPLVFSSLLIRINIAQSDNIKSVPPYALRLDEMKSVLNWPTFRMQKTELHVALQSLWLFPNIYFQCVST